MMQISHSKSKSPPPACSLLVDSRAPLANFAAHLVEYRIRFFEDANGMIGNNHGEQPKDEALKTLPMEKNLQIQS